jgi:GNAT superfamily N-acetyltransferase
MSSGSRYRLEVLNDQHSTGNFACEEDEINEYIRNEALADMARGLARTFVETDQEKPATFSVAGFFTLRAHAANIRDEDSEYPDETIEVPLVELMWLARDLQWKGQGLGDTLMIDVLETVAKAASYIGFMGLHLRTTMRGRPLYEKYDFQLFRAHPHSDGARYILSIQDILAIVERVRNT